MVSTVDGHLFLSGEKSERTLQELHLAVPAAHRPAQPFLLGQTALRGRDQQRHGREAHLQPRGGDGMWSHSAPSSLHASQLWSQGGAPVLWTEDHPGIGRHGVFFIICSALKWVPMKDALL